MQYADPNTPIDILVQQPWTVEVTHDAENGYVVRVRELPDAIATADSPRELDREFWAAVRASIVSRCEFGLPIPIVDGFRLAAPHLGELVRFSAEPRTAAGASSQLLMA